MKNSAKLIFGTILCIVLTTGCKKDDRDFKNAFKDNTNTLPDESNNNTLKTKNFRSTSPNGEMSAVQIKPIGGIIIRPDTSKVTR